MLPCNLRLLLVGWQPADVDVCGWCGVTPIQIWQRGFFRANSTAAPLGRAPFSHFPFGARWTIGSTRHTQQSGHRLFPGAPLARREWLRPRSLGGPAGTMRVLMRVTRRRVPHPPRPLTLALLRVRCTCPHGRTFGRRDKSQSSPAAVLGALQFIPINYIQYCRLLLLAQADVVGGR